MRAMETEGKAKEAEYLRSLNEGFHNARWSSIPLLEARLKNEEQREQEE